MARRGAAIVAQQARAAVTARGRFALALSGGRTPWAMAAALGDEDVPWERVALYQVDERLVAAGDANRNLTQLVAALPTGATAAELHPMPVAAGTDLDLAAASYAQELPDRLDLVHLGLGEDGHTASLVLGDPVLDVRDRRVSVSGPYQGHRRMTLTYPAIDRARAVLWLVTGEGKRGALLRLRAGDEAIPAGRVRTAEQLLLADAAAADGQRLDVTTAAARPRSGRN